MNKFSKSTTHVLCRRCNRTSYLKRINRCSYCRAGQSSKLYRPLIRK